MGNLSGPAAERTRRADQRLKPNSESRTRTICPGARRAKNYSLEFFPERRHNSVSLAHNLAPNQPLFNAATETKDYNTFTIPVDVSWEPDLWGKVRRSVEASRSEAQATGADLANVSLSLHAELASDYFQLRGLDAQKQLLPIPPCNPTKKRSS